MLKFPAVSEKLAKTLGAIFSESPVLSEDGWKFIQASQATAQN